MKGRTKRLLAGTACAALLSASVVGGTLAYYTDTDSDVNVMTMGNVQIEQTEQERDADGKLVDFTQAKPLAPAVYKGTSIPWDDAEKWAVANDEAWKTVARADGDNVIDKFVTVKNTGKSAAYVRTIIAYEGDAIDGDDIHIVQNAIDSSNAGVKGEFAATDYIKDVTIDGTRYDVIVYTYKEALAPNETTIPSLKQVYMDKGCDNEDAAKYGETYDILVLSQAVQTAGFADAKAALDEGFGAVGDSATNTESMNRLVSWLAEVAPSVSGTSEELKTQLSQNKKEIVVNLTGDVTYDVAAWAANGMGGDITESITINGNGYTVNFNQTNSDWNNVVTANGAKLIINNAKITNSGHNDGPWNRHDINFACDVELNNVTSDKALAFKAGAKLSNVTISDANTSDTYAIWIQPNGQTVTLDGCTIDMIACTDGRGIKIDEQYIDAPQKVVLNVANTTFKTEEKAAILVKSVAGADITLSNVDISGVAADPVNPVWVDEASKDYANLVKVNEGSAPTEGTPEATVARADSDTALDEAIKGGAGTVVLGSGNYIIPDAAKGKTLTIIGTGDTAIATQDDGSYEGCDYSLDGATVTFQNITITTDSSTYTGYARLNATYNNCTINGTYTLYGDSTFNDCTFNVSGDVYNIWTWGAPNATFNNCTFNSDGKAILLYGTANTRLTVSGCTFNDNGGLSDLKAAIEIGNDYGKSYELIVNDTVVNGYEINDKGISTGTTLWANKNSMGTDKLNVVVDGVDVY